MASRFGRASFVPLSSFDVASGSIGSMVVAPLISKSLTSYSGRSTVYPLTTFILNPQIITSSFPLMKLTTFSNSHFGFMSLFESVINTTDPGCGRLFSCSGANGCLSFFLFFFYHHHLFTIVIYSMYTITTRYGT